MSDDRILRRSSRQAHSGRREHEQSLSVTRPNSKARSEQNEINGRSLDAKKDNALKRKRPDAHLTAKRTQKKSKTSNEVGSTSINNKGAYWLLKAEPESRIEKGKDVKFSIDDLQACTVPEPWSGVRNHVAKNNMLAMKKGDLAFFYHSSCKVPGLVGIMEVVKEATPDLSAFDAKDPYYDEKSDQEKPRWFNVHVEFRTKFAQPEKTTLTELRKCAVDGPLANMALLKQSRLSVSRVSLIEWNFILDVAGESQYRDESAPEP